MEVVLLLVALLGIALIAVPRIQRRRSAARRPARRRAPARQAKAVAATPPVATWTPPARSGEWEVWDDELGWEGVDAAPAPEPEPVAEREPDRAQWERWRAEELAPEAEEPAHEPTQALGGELPSVERWRERHAAGDDWDDDGLGWEGAAAPPVRDFGRDEPPPVSPARDEVAPLRPRDWDHDDVATPPARAWADDVPARPWADDVPAPPARDWSRTGHDPAHANGNGNGVAPATALNGNGAAPISVARVAEPVEEWPADDAWEAKPATQAAN